MAQKNFDDLNYGDETRRHGDYVGLPHDQDQSETGSGSNNDVREGEAVAVDSNGNIAKADIDGAGAAIGVLYTYQYFQNEGQQVDQDRDATVKTQGTVKARVGSGVSAGDHLAAPATATSGTAGVLDASSSTEDSNFVALSDARQQDLPDGTTSHYAEVLIL